MNKFTGHREWLEERRKGIGGSDAAGILGLNPWKTAYRVYQEKRKEVERERIVILPENEQDKAYIEGTLGLKEEGETIPCKRIAPMGLSRSITCLEIRGKEENEE